MLWKCEDPITFLNRKDNSFQAEQSRLKTKIHVLKLFDTEEGSKALTPTSTVAMIIRDPFTLHSNLDIIAIQIRPFSSTNIALGYQKCISHSQWSIFE